MNREIRFPDGSVMEFAEWRRWRLNDAQSIADHGDFMHGLGRRLAGFKAFSAINLAVLSMPFFEQGRPFLSGLCMGGAMTCLGFSLWMQRDAVSKRQECLASRQAILDNIRAVERAFEALEKAENDL